MSGTILIHKILIEGKISQSKWSTFTGHTGRKTLLYTNNALKVLNLLTFGEKRMRFSYAESEAKRET